MTDEDQSRVVGRQFHAPGDGDLPHHKPDALPSYDQKQAAAVLIVRPCCGRQMFATNPRGRCASCR